MLQFRKAAPEDHKELTDIAIESKSFWNYPEEALAAYASNLEVFPEEIQKGIFYKLLIADEVIGFYGFQHSPKSKSVQVTFMFIRKKFIGQGYGSKLLKHCLNEVDHFDVGNITLSCDSNAFENFYKYKGFQIMSESLNSLGRTLTVELRLKGTNHT